MGIPSEEKGIPSEEKGISSEFGEQRKEKRIYIIYSIYVYSACARMRACEEKSKKENPQRKNPCGLKKHEVKIPFLSFAGKRPSALCPCFLS